jgi:hypothetical protein
MPTERALSRLRMSPIIRAVTAAEAAAFRGIRPEALRPHPAPDRAEVTGPVRRSHRPVAPRRLVVQAGRRRKDPEETA